MNQFYPGCLVLVIGATTMFELLGKCGTLVEFQQGVGIYVAPDGQKWQASCDSPGWFVDFEDKVVKTFDGQYSRYALFGQVNLMPISDGDKLVEQEQEELVLER